MIAGRIRGAVAGAILGVVLSGDPGAAGAVIPEHEVLVMFRDGALALPEGTERRPDQLTFRDPQLRNILTAHRASAVARACPDARPEQAVKRLADGRTIHSLDLSKLVRIRTTSQPDRDQLRQALTKSDEVLFAEANQRIVYRGVPRDPDFPKQWNLMNIGQAGGAIGADIDATRAWDRGTGSPLSRIAVVDGGVDGDIADFESRVSGTYGLDPHGTAIASIAAASGNNGVQLAGISWGSPIISVVIADGDIPSAATGIRDAVDAGADIINASWGFSSHSHVLADAIAYAHQHNVLIVAAMPEDGAPGDFPNRYVDLGVMNVGATTNLDQPASYSEPASYIDVSAPGGETLGPPGNDIFAHSLSPTYVVGTSYAAAHVSGAAAVVQSRLRAFYDPPPQVTGKDLRGILRASADDIAPQGWDSQTGTGRINLNRAVPTTYTLGSPPPLIGGTDMGASASYSVRLFNVPDPRITSGQEYYVKMHEVQRSIGNATPGHIWGLGSSTGWPGISPSLPEEERELFNTGWCEPVPGTSSPMVLRTYVYQVFTALGAFIDWFPCEPSQVVYYYRLYIGQDGQALGSTPDAGQSYFVPQADSSGTLFEGALATRYFRACPNNDGGASLPRNARIKVVLRDPSGTPIAGVAAADIAVVFNGGTAAQGFLGAGADSVISNGLWNQAPLCPDVRILTADAATDANGVSYITFSGSTPGSPGVATRDPNRKWGHYDAELPVFALGTQIQGRFTSGGANGSYILRIKNFDFQGGLTAQMNQGEMVSATDINSVANNIGVNDALSYWRDFDSSGEVTAGDYNMIAQHGAHDCDTPNNP